MLHRRRLPLSVSLAVAVVVAAAAGRAGPRGGSYSSGRHALRLDAPTGWELSTHTGYPTILALFVHADGSRLSLSASQTAAEDVRALVEQNRPGLTGQGFAIAEIKPGPRDALLLQAADRRSRIIRQAYLVRPFRKGTRQAIVLTLTCSVENLAARAAALDLALKRLDLRPVEDPDAGIEETRSEAAGVGPDASSDR